MKFENVDVVKEANVYFDGKVNSRTICFKNGERKTLGFMLAGEYEFATGAEELMEVLGGEMDICLPGESSYTTYKTGENFVVPADSKFEIIVRTYSDYCCSYKEAAK
ncbi:pyrimidine/purine nucleoside phosphorylase [Anaerocolumna sp. AGMB13020]|uniref:pyrimidine/purine nucleoside phosphorylase n=1 Tax=Anaerocolumna sp. AGMB13020 TaxID=3081750 RepID=UPI0029556CC0|nr:pyrimidine/purine nucleoside phosphorylase [Anaerocolumna sp. AGMB13020]WOO36490.1 pyrimidine/purine nucleoside phosphorylase [Anaerocolumna sp. AGMB13020]